VIALVQAATKWSYKKASERRAQTNSESVSDAKLERLVADVSEKFRRASEKCRTVGQIEIKILHGNAYAFSPNNYLL
jgi:predicted Zn-dependent protease